MNGGEQRTGHRRRRRRRSTRDNALRQWAKDDEPQGDEREEANLGIVIAVAVGLLLLLCLYYISGQLEYEAPF